MKLMSFLCVLLLSAILANAQDPPTPAARAAQLRATAQKILRETPHRMTMTIEHRDNDDSPWALYSSQTKAVVAPRHWHLVQHTGLRREMIQIGDQTWEKPLGGDWRPMIFDRYTGPTIRPVGKPIIENSVEERKDGTKTIETSGQAKLEIIRTGEIVDNDRKVKEWYDDSGRLVRVETVHFNFERKWLQRNIEVYEYDPTIKVEAPIFNQ